MGKIYDQLGIEERVMIQTRPSYGGHLWGDCSRVGSPGIDDLARTKTQWLGSTKDAPRPWTSVEGWRLSG